MKKTHNTAARTFTALLLTCSATATYRSQCMEPPRNNCITIVNEHHNPNSLLQLNYTQIEVPHHSKNPNVVGMNVLINSPTTMKCFIKNHKNRSSLQLSDPHSNEKKIQLKVINGTCLTIHEKKDAIIIIEDQNKIALGYLSYY